MNAPLARRFDDSLPRLRADALKAMVRTYGGSGTLRRDQALAYLPRALANPEQMRRTAEGISPIERNILAFLKQMGGTADSDALTIALRASGIPIPRRREFERNDSSDLIQPMIRRGLLLTAYPSDPTYMNSYGSTGVFADERLLQHIGTPEIRPFDLAPTAPPSQTTYRRPPTVVLDLISILRAIDDRGGLQLTQSGTVRVGDMRQLARALGWQDETLELDGFALPDAPLAFVEAFSLAGLLRREGNALVVKVALEEFAAQPYEEQIGAVCRGFILTTRWSEPASPSRFGQEARYHPQGRMALCVALAALPEADGFFVIKDLSDALFARVGRYFSLDFPPPAPYYFRESPAEIERKEKERVAQLRADWNKQERPWLAQALATWLYLLGVVELGVEGKTAVSVRLTELGEALLHPERPRVPVAHAPSPAPAWVVQPNFQVIVYLDRASAPQLAFLERYAERVQAQQHTAQYRLTRESVYRGLESGGVLTNFLEELAHGAHAPLPSNVVTELREWGALREKMTLARRANVLEFETESARAQAIEQGLTGAPIGERFLLLQRGAAERRHVAARWVASTVDYARPLERCLRVTEKGRLTLTTGAQDLLIVPQLDNWAERLEVDQRAGQGKWQLTAERVHGAVQRGARVGELLKLLEARLTHPLPPLLAIAVRAWAGERFHAQLAKIMVLHCKDQRLAEAIVASETFKRFLRGQISDQVFWVDAERLSELQQELARLGLRVSDEFELERLAE